ncbi:MAG: hypothetical protein K8R53_08730 [Bacteroidales bacterium]|nr:hypothetical protein [Bacteroidales bacterium]
MKIDTKKIIYLLFLVMGAVIWINVLAVNAADWSIQVADPTHVFNDNSDHALAIGSDGTIYVAYGDKNLYMAKKIPGRVDWVIEVVDSSSQVGGYASLALDSNNNPHISYQDRDNYELKYARYDGSSWHIEVAGSQGGYIATGTSIALDSNNRPHIAYFDRYFDRLYYAHFNGTAWQYATVGTLSNAWDSLLHPSIALDSNDHPHIVCCYYWYNVLHNLKHYFFDGSVWNNQTILNGTGFFPSIAIDNNDHIHISYRGTGGSNNAGLGYGYYNGSIWQTSNISAGAELAASTAITVDGDNNPHIGYFDTNTGGGLKHAKYNGSIWQFESVSSNSGAGTSIVVDSVNDIHISSIGSNELRYSSDTGGTWATQTLDYSSGSGRYTTIAVDSVDRPHISHYAGLINRLKYTYHNGSEFVSEIVDPTTLVSSVQSPSLALDSSDQPHIVYYNYESGTHLLKYAHHDGVVWNLEDIVDGYYNMSVAIDNNDRPHICYTGIGCLKYAVYNGSTWEIQILASGAYTPHCPSIALDSNDRPHIIYFDRVDVEFRYGIYNGTTWNFETLSTSTSNSTSFKTTSIAMDSQDLPHVCWTDSTRINYANYNGTQWSIQESIDTGADYMDMALDSSDYPRLSYFNANGSDLKYAVYDGTIWQMETVDEIGSVGQYSSIALDSGDNPHISYFDATNDELKYAFIPADLCECNLNTDTVCDMQDWLLFGEDWGRSDCGTPPGSGNLPNDCECDLNHDGKCDMQDWLMFGEDWGRTDCPVIP